VSCVQSVTVEVVRAPNPTQPTSILLQLQGEENENENRLHPTPEIRGHPYCYSIPDARSWKRLVGCTCRAVPAGCRHYPGYPFAAHATDASKQASSSSALRSAVEWSEAKLQLACTRGSPPCSGGHLYSESFCPDWTPPTGKAMAMAWSVRQVRITCNNRLSTRYISLLEFHMSSYYVHVTNRLSNLLRLLSNNRSPHISNNLPLKNILAHSKCRALSPRACSSSSNFFSISSLVLG
jgi:hypothetical protein